MHTHFGPVWMIWITKGSFCVLISWIKYRCCEWILFVNCIVIHARENKSPQIQSWSLIKHWQWHLYACIWWLLVTDIVNCNIWWLIEYFNQNSRLHGHHLTKLYSSVAIVKHIHIHTHTHPYKCVWFYVNKTELQLTEPRTHTHTHIHIHNTHCALRSTWVAFRIHRLRDR